MPTPIDTLQKLQKVDLEIGAVEGESGEYREKIDTLTSEIEGLTIEAELLTQSVEEIETTVKEVEEGIRENSDRIKRNEGKTGVITTDKAFKALNKETSTAKKSVKVEKERLEKLAPEAAEKRAALDQMLLKIEEKKEAIQVLTEEMEGKNEGWESVLVTKRAERETVASAIDAGLVRKYERICERRRGIGLVEVKREVCQGCFMNLPPQLYIKLMRGDEELLDCPNCHRILYCEREKEAAEGA